MENELVVQTLCLAVFLGVAGQFLAHRLRVPALVCMVVLGIAAGPSFVHLLHTDRLLQLTTALISVGVAVILFEGGMTLNLKDLKAAPRATANLIIIGPLVTMAAVAAALHIFLALPWNLSFLTGAILSVSAPTVLAPLLERVNVTKRLKDILTWEAILVEAVGGILMVVVLQFIVSESDSHLHTFLYFLKKLAIGAAAGFGTGKLLSFIIRRRLIGHHLLNPGIVALLLAVFWLANHFAHESGLLAMVIAGLMVGQVRHPALEEIRAFKEQLSLLILSVIFILIAANIDLGRLASFGRGAVPAVAAVLFLARPLTVFLTTVGSGLSVREKLFLAWTSPRGVIALATAALFTLILEHAGFADAGAVEAFVFIIIVVTVILQGLGMGPVARLLKVKAPPRNGYLIVGVHPFSLAVARLLADADLPVLLMDSRPGADEEARDAGLPGVCCNILDEEEVAAAGLDRMGGMLALTGNDETNTLVCRIGRKLFGQDNSFQIINTFLSHVTDEVLLDFGGRPAFDMKMSVEAINQRLDTGTVRVERLTLEQRDGGYVLPDHFMSALFYLLPGRAAVAQENDKPRSAECIALTLGI